LKAKLEKLLNTPMVSDEAAILGAQPHRPSDNGLGRILRVAFWNIERGMNFDLIRLALSDPEAFKQAAARLGSNDKDEATRVDEQIWALRDADVVLLNKVDLGMKRTDYRDVARALAHALRMNYVFGVEFVEVDRLEDLGIEPVELEDPALARKMQDELKADPARYRGLHGKAILSRYPMQNARIVRLPVCHDWFRTERAEISAIEKGKRFGANKLFLERIEREVRQSGRMALIADMKIPELAGGWAHLHSPRDSAARHELRVLGYSSFEMGDSGLAALADVDSYQLFQKLLRPDVRAFADRWRQPGGAAFPARRAVPLRGPQGFRFSRRNGAQPAWKRENARQQQSAHR